MAQADHKVSMVEISLGDAHYKEDSEIVPKNINHKYIQRNGAKGIVRGFMLFDDIYLYYSLRFFNLKKFKSRQLPKHRIDLTYLDSKPMKSIHIAWKWLFWGLVIIASSVLVIYVGKFSDVPIKYQTMLPDQAVLPVGILLGTLGFVSTLLFYYKSYSNVIYRSYVGRAPLIELTHKPRSKNYKLFIDVLEAGIKKAQCRNGITIKDRLVGEMKDMRRLRDAGVISEKVYKLAQTRIFDHEENQV